MAAAAGTFEGIPPLYLPSSPPSSLPFPSHFPPAVLGKSGKVPVDTFRLRARPLGDFVLGPYDLCKSFRSLSSGDPLYAGLEGGRGDPQIPSVCGNLKPRFCWMRKSAWPGCLPVATIRLRLRIYLCVSITRPPPPPPPSRMK